jgi:acyl-CoA hydrolase
MRKAIELAFISVRDYSGNKDPKFVSIDTIYFLKPVSIGSILKFESVVIFADDKSGNVRVRVKASTVSSL